MTGTAQEIRDTLTAQIGEVVFGAEALVESLTIALIVQGHVLLQGVPGIGKTLLGKTLAAQLGGEFRRIQCTPDLMPADIVGVHIYRAHTHSFEFIPGPLFADVVLVDEINRTGPKTQSGLLEAMEERRVTLERDVYALPNDFLVIATQNPHEFEGTYPLPESQLDRFLLRLEMGYPARAAEARVLATYDRPGSGHQPAPPTAPLGNDRLQRARAEVARIHVSEAVYGYVLDIAAASRQRADIALGLSTRGALAIIRCARVAAALRGGRFVTPDDIKAVATQVAAHRLVLTPEALLEGAGEAQIVESLLAAVEVPR